MATYAELRSLFPNSDLLNKVEVACIIAAEAIRNEAPPANAAARDAWASKAFSNSGEVARQMLKALLAAEKDTALASILSATDAAIQTRVDAAVDLFADNA